MKRARTARRHGAGWPNLRDARRAAHQPQTADAHELPEVGVPGDQADVVVDAALGDQGVGEPCPSLQAEHPGRAGHRPAPSIQAATPAAGSARGARRPPSAASDRSAFRSAPAGAGTPGGRRAIDRRGRYRVRWRPRGRRSTRSSRRRSWSVCAKGFQVDREAHVPPQAAESLVCRAGSHQLEAVADGGREVLAARSLRLLEQVRRNLEGYFARCAHDAMNTSTSAVCQYGSCPRRCRRRRCDRSGVARWRSWFRLDSIPRFQVSSE